MVNTIFPLVNLSFYSNKYSLQNVDESYHLCRIGPEKGVIHIALGAVNNALWDMYARSRKKPLWKLIVDMTPVSNVLTIFNSLIHGPWLV